jgi:hypothetical protein
MAIKILSARAIIWQLTLVKSTHGKKKLSLPMTNSRVGICGTLASLPFSRFYCLASVAKLVPKFNLYSAAC